MALYRDDYLTSLERDIERWEQDLEALDPKFVDVIGDTIRRWITEARDLLSELRKR